MSIVRFLIRSKFSLTSRAAATRQLQEETRRTLTLVESVSDSEAARPVTVPPMTGVDEDMQNWSLFMLLEHNTIVNRIITRVISTLAEGKEIQSTIDPKRDVLPSADAGPDQIAAFRESVEAHFETVAGLGSLRKTAPRLHPIFGPLTAHQWHCMFGFHLMLHRRQADAIVKRLKNQMRSHSR